MRRPHSGSLRLATAASVLTIALATGSTRPSAEPPAPVTFAGHIAPILARSCQRCHRAGGMAPMSLTTYEEARPWAAAIKRETARRAMPPWFVDQDVGIQRYRDDPSLTDAEVATVAAWADAGAPRGAGDTPPAPPVRPASGRWSIGEPDLVVSSPEFTVEAVAPDWWGDLAMVPTGLTEDRYVAAIETLEISDRPSMAVLHHAGVQAFADGQFEFGTIHEVGRNAETYDPEAAPRLRAGSVFGFNNAHLHAGGQKTTARLVVGVRFLPRGSTPRFATSGLTLGSPELDVRGNTPGQSFEAFATLPQAMKLVTLEPHMHAAGSRMCLDAQWGVVRQTLTCVGFNPRWVRTYSYDADAAPLLPRGTILRLTGWMDTTPRAGNPYLVDFRNWTGWGSRPVDNMFMSYLSVVMLNPDQLKALVAQRLEKVRRGEADLRGCLPCTLPFALDQGTAR